MTRQEAFTLTQVCRLFEIEEKTLLIFEEEGLVGPTETAEGLYTQEDIARIRFILELTDDLGVNLAGAEVIIRMREQMDAMRRQFSEILRYVHDEMSQLLDENYPDLRQEAERRIGEFIDLDALWTLTKRE